MARDQALTERQRALLAELTSVTITGTLRWERQVGSAHRYAKWNENLLILGPTDSLDDQEIPRYLFLTPLNSPNRHGDFLGRCGTAHRNAGIGLLSRGRNSDPGAERPIRFDSGRSVH